MNHSDVERRFLEQRLEAISAGLKEGVRREVQRLRELGLPIYVIRDGKVVDLQGEQPPESHKG